MRLSAVIVLAIAVCGLLGPGRASAQALQSITAIVNDDIVTSRDLDTRMRLVLVSTGQQPSPENMRRVRDQALRTLIDEQLQIQEAKRQGITVGQADLQRAYDIISRENNVPQGQFDNFLSQVGIDKESLAQQIRAEIAWQKLLRQRISPTIQVADEDVEQAIAKAKASVGQQEMLLAEIFLSVDNPDQEEEVFRTAERIVDQIQQAGNFAAFPSLARQFSQGTSAASGGDLGWVQPGTLPEELDTAAAGLQIGRISNPIRGPGGYYILALRDRRAIAGPDLAQSTVTLSQLVVPLARDASPEDVEKQTAEARRLATELKSCNDVDKLKEQVGTKESGSLGTVKIGDLPQDFASAVKDLKVNQVVGPIRNDNGMTLLIVCERQDAASNAFDPEQVREAIANRRMGMLARRYLRDLRRDATIEIR